MLIFETYEFASIWMKVAATTSFEAIAIIRAEDKFNAGEYWRDRTDEVKKMLVGFGGENDRVFESVYTGSQLKEMGWEIEGARIAYNFKVIWK